MLEKCRIHANAAIRYHKFIRNLIRCLLHDPHGKSHSSFIAIILDCIGQKIRENPFYMYRASIDTPLHDFGIALKFESHLLFLSTHAKQIKCLPDDLCNIHLFLFQDNRTLFEFTHLQHII